MIVSQGISRAIGQLIGVASQSPRSYGRTDGLTNEERSWGYLTLKSSPKPTRPNETPGFIATNCAGAFGARLAGIR